jgi:ribosome-associated heat shock protein Hsp15
MALHDVHKDDSNPYGMRLDKWLWAARLCKTRALAVRWAELGRVEVDGRAAKPGRTVHTGSVLRLRLPGAPPRELTVLALCSMRGPARVAQTLYEESAASLAAGAAWAASARLAPEPATTRSDGRPTKRERRSVDAASGRWQRWSASVDD